MSGQVPKLGLKYWKLRARKFTLHLINAAEINAQHNKVSVNGALISYNKVSVFTLVGIFSHIFGYGKLKCVFAIV